MGSQPQHIRTMGIQSEHHPRCTVMQSRAVNYLLTKLRQKDLPTDQFQTIGDRLMRLLGEEALARLPTVVDGQVDTPCGVAKGYVDTPGPPVCVVSIVRSGDILQEARSWSRGTRQTQTSLPCFPTRNCPRI